MEFTTIHQRESSITFPARVKLYPGGQCEILAAEKPVFRAVKGWESEEARHVYKAAGTSDNLDRSRRRATARIQDLARCTPFDWFVTLTLDASQIDRYDYSAVIRKLGNYCGNRVQREGLRYILVPELHKDGAIHFHGFFGGLPDRDFISSGTFTGGAVKGKPKRPRTAAQMERWIDSGAHEVFNLSSWKYGFTTAVRLEPEHDRAITYMCKYIRKAPEKVGGRWYLSGGELREPERQYLNVTASEVSNIPDSYTFCVPGNCFSMWRGNAERLAAWLASGN